MELTEQWLNELANRLRTFFDSDDTAGSRMRGKDILLELFLLSGSFIRRLPAREILSLLAYQNDLVYSKDGLRILEAIRDGLDHQVNTTEWRSLRVCHDPVPSDVWEDFWADFASPDSLRYSDPFATVAPALELGEERFVERAIRAYDLTPTADVETRERLEELF